MFFAIFFAALVVVVVAAVVVVVVVPTFYMGLKHIIMSCQLVLLGFTEP